MLINLAHTQNSHISILYMHPSFCPPLLSPEGGQGCLMSPSCLESQGCHLTPLSYLLSCFFCLVLFSLSVIFCLMVHSPDFFPIKLKYISLRVRIFCMALVEQLGDDSW